MCQKSFVRNLVTAGALLLAVLVAARGAGAGGAPRVTTLSGAEEVPGPGDPDGSGFASIVLNHGQRRICWAISFANIAPPVAAHIHVGPVGVAGPIVVPLDPIVSGCTTVDRKLIKAIIQNSELYYVNVHTADFLAGAIRGQLSNRGQSE
jgi:hypothetical protein